MERTQFTFYESFFKAISRIKKDADRCKAYDALCAYALYGAEPDMDVLPDSAAIAFELSKPNLDASRRKASNGKRGGERKQTGSKPEANAKQTASKKEKEIEKEIENECYNPLTPLPPSRETNAVSAVLADYLDRINPVASPASLDELKGFAEVMGEAVCKRAFDISLDSKKATWPYIRGILQDKQARGVRCLADWDALEEKRKERHGRNNGPDCENQGKKYNVGTDL